MKSLQYFLMKIAGNKRYSARTVVRNRYDRRGFINKIIARNPTLKKEEVELVLNEAFATAEVILKEGSALVVPGLIKVAPVIKGIFKGPLDEYKRGRNSVHISCTVSSKINRLLGQTIKAERIAPPSRTPLIELLLNSKEEWSKLTLTRSNTFVGSDLKRVGYRLAELIISAESDEKKRIILNLEQIEIIEHRDKKLTFCFLRDYTPPAWLNEGEAIKIVWAYIKEKSGQPMYSQPYNTFWQL